MEYIDERDIDNLLRQRRQKAVDEAAVRRERAFASDGELKRLEDDIVRLRVEKLRAIRTGAEAADIDRRIAAATDAFGARLAADGFPQDYLKPHYKCEKCRDTGYIGTQRCSCRDRLVYEIMYRRASLAGAGEQCFDNFDAMLFDGPDEISKRQRLMMEKMLSFGRKYAADFEPGHSKNLIFSGPTGTGKTFLANCIAGEVLKKGFGVLAVSSYALLEQLRDASFNGTGRLRRICGIDLLIIDELGMEQMMSNVTIELLFMVVNERYRKGLPCIITTNLLPEQLTQRYTERITSRLFDRSRSSVLRFEGNDVRRREPGKRNL